MSQRCDELLIQTYVDGALDPEQAQAVAAHCRVCVPCGQVLRELRVTCQALRLEAEAPPPALHERLLQAVAGLEPLAALSCEEAQEWVSLQLDGELTHEQIQQLQAHLQACSACYLAASQTELATSILRHVTEEPAPAGLLDRVQAAVALASGQPQVRPVPWKRWGLSLGAVAAAAALLLAFLTRLGPAPVNGPMVAQQPIPAPVVTATPANPTAKAVEAAVARLAPAASQPTEKPRLRVAVSPEGRTTVTSVPQTREPSPAAVSPPTNLPPAPAPVMRETPRPVAIAAVPAAPERPVTPHEIIAPAARPVAPAPRVTSPAPLTAPEPETPRPTRVATVDVPSPAPRPEPAPTRVATKPRSSWVSREADDDREVYASSDGHASRLADARHQLAEDITTIRNSRMREFVIR